MGEDVRVGERRVRGQRHRWRAIREVDAARTGIVAGESDDVPFWALAWGPPVATVHSRAAKVFESLGERREAAEQYGAAAAHRPQGTYARIVALDLVAQAEMQIAQGGVEQACGTWNRAIDAMDGVRSVRTRKAIKTMRRSLTPFRARGLRCAQDLDERATVFLATSR